MQNQQIIKKMNKAELILINRLLSAIFAVVEHKQIILTSFLELLRAMLRYKNNNSIVLDNESPVHKNVNM